MTAPTYTPAQLRRLIALAEELGFWDDAGHWKRLLAESEPHDSGTETR